MSETTMRQSVESVLRAQSGPPQQFSPEVLARVTALKGMQNAVMRGALEGTGDDALRDVTSAPINACGGVQ